MLFESHCNRLACKAFCVCIYGTKGWTGKYTRVSDTAAAVSAYNYLRLGIARSRRFPVMFVKIIEPLPPRRRRRCLDTPITNTRNTYPRPLPLPFSYSFSFSVDFTSLRLMGSVNGIERKRVNVSGKRIGSREKEEGEGGGVVCFCAGRSANRDFNSFLKTRKGTRFLDWIEAYLARELP